jgi:transposase InsO family protein
MKGDPTVKKQDDHPDETLDLALWRYGIISPLLHGHGDDRSLTLKMKALAEGTYLRPDGIPVQPTFESLRKWLYRYRRGGLSALKNQPRADKGTHQVPENLATAMFELRERHPRWTIALMLQHLLETGRWNGRKPSESALYRFAARHHLQRDPRLPDTAAVQPFAFDAFGQMWIADFLHGPKIRTGRNKRKTLLHMIIDDASRWGVQGGFGFSETVEAMIRDLVTAVRRFGIPERLYVDNGPCYQSRHLKLACARAGIHLLHTPAYRPQGRGKVERFFRTVRDQFLASDTSKTIEQLNVNFDQWLSLYHRRIHSRLECSPLEKRMSIPNVCKPVPETADVEPLFRMERRCRVYKDGTIRLKNRLFEVPGAAPGARVTIYYMPWDLSNICYGESMLTARDVNLSENARRFDRPGGDR